MENQLQIIDSVFYISEARVPSLSAHSIQILQMCDAIDRAICPLTLIVPQYGKPLTRELILDTYGLMPTFAIRNIPLTLMRGRSTIFQVRAAVMARRSPNGVVYTRDLRTALYAISLNIDTILESHAPIFSKLGAHLFSLLSRRKCFLRHVVISKTLRSIYDTSYPGSAHKRFVAHDGAHLSNCIPRKTRCPPNSLVIGYVGSLYKGRGVDLIVELALQCPWANFVLLGGNDTDVHSWRSRTEQIQNISFIGHVSHQATDQFRCDCDILLAPYQENLETFGNGIDTSRWMSPLKVFEYLSSSVPIIASDLPAIREVLTDGKTALLCRPSALEEWVAAVRRLRDDVALRQTLSTNGLGLFERQYTWTTRARNIFSAYQQEDV